MGQDEAEGIYRQKAVMSLDKLAQSGQIDPGVDLQTITDTRLSIISEVFEDDKQDEQTPRDEREAKGGIEDQDSESTNLSQREIMEKAIETQDNPTEDDILSYAADHGLSHDKTQRLLKKMKQHREVRESMEYPLSLV